MSEYLTLARLAAIVAPILFSMLAFYFACSGALRKFCPRYAVFYVRITTATVFMAFALAEENRSYLTFNFPQENFSLLLTVLVSIGINRLARKAGAKESVQKSYPQLRTVEWSNTLMAINSLTWLIYLFGYELFFRGYLLYSARDFMSVPAAIGLNLIFYALGHSLKGWREILGSIPFGLLVCGLTISTGNIWSAFIIHGTMALSAEWFTAKRMQTSRLNKPHSIRSYENV